MKEVRLVDVKDEIGNIEAIQVRCLRCDAVIATVPTRRAAYYHVETILHHECKAERKK